MTAKPLADVERIKAASRLLRGTIEESLADPVTGALAADDTQLIKFHGSYQQDDRDVRAERRQALLEPAYSFMVRVRIPGGICTSRQWLDLDALAGRHANGTLRLTTRQTIQFHGILKRDLKASLAAIDATLLNTLAACGDVNRNVMSATLPVQRALHEEVLAVARDLSDHLLPRTRAYHEIWLGAERVTPEVEEVEPIYGRNYLPRKFKIGMAVPPDNDVDVFTQDLGYLAIVEDGRLVGFDVTAGGGMGMSFGEPATYPRLGDVLGFCTPEQALAVAVAVVTAQRDLGDRTDRKHARLKYTIDTVGLDAFRTEVERRQGFAFAPARPYAFSHTGDRFGWFGDDRGLWHFGLFVEGGRITDRGAWRARSGLRAIAERHAPEFRLTANQNLLISGIDPDDRGRVAALLAEYGIDGTSEHPARQLALACVGLPTCGLAMADSERYIADFMTRFESLLARHGLADEEITVRMTGCPNGCARPYVAEVALVGKAPGRYNLYLGGAFDGSRLNAQYRENLDEPALLAALDPLLAAYAGHRQSGERFGDFLVRTGIVPAIGSGRAFAAATLRPGAGT
ncbi:MAG: assimilatory sulfite reductase (NADPH) hemoprotein subunit [Gammaproteobacteria bacterium]|nr:assimilatory sulfite reductase (NADPH) hemoprotein subunit [Gammaproteobacteria bacterium]